MAAVLDRTHQGFQVIGVVEIVVIEVGYISATWDAEAGVAGR